MMKPYEPNHVGWYCDHCERGADQREVVGNKHIACGHPFDTAAPLRENGTAVYFAAYLALIIGVGGSMIAGRALPLIIGLSVAVLAVAGLQIVRARK